MKAEICVTVVATNERFTWQIVVQTSCIAHQPSATAAMTDDMPLPFDLSSVGRKKVTVVFDGGNQSSEGGLLLLRHAERKLGVCGRLADAMPDRRDPSRVLADELSGACVVPSRRARPATVRPVNRGGVCPDEPPTQADQPQSVACRVVSHRSTRTDRQRATARPT
jgi:hypothetical protein